MIDRKRVKSLIERENRVTRNQVSATLCLSAPFADRLLDDLKDEGFIYEEGRWIYLNDGRNGTIVHGELSTKI